jgi:hypothetical protein
VFAARELATLCARATLFTRWDQVMRLAKALDRHKILVGEQVREAALGLVRIDPTKHFVRIGGKRHTLREVAGALDHYGHHFDAGKPVGLTKLTKAERGTAWQ